MKENQKLKNVVLDQQNSLYQMKEKENKLIKLLQGVKKRGIDLDEIFREEIAGENAENSSKENDSEKGNLHLDSSYKDKFITENSKKTQFFFSSVKENELEQDRNQADESSSFYFYLISKNV